MVEDSLPALDDVFQLISTSSFGVESSNIGYDKASSGVCWTKIHSFSESISGAFKWVDAQGDTTGSAMVSSVQAPVNPRSYQGLGDSSLPGYVQKKITLVEGMGNLFVPQAFLRADKLEASLTSAVEDIVRGTAKNVANREITAFYSLNDISMKNICTVGGVITAGTGLAGSPVVVAIAGGSVRQFYNGMQVEVWNSAATIQKGIADTSSGAPSASATNHYNYFVVDGVTYLPSTSDSGGYGRINLKTRSGIAVGGTAVTTGDIIVHAGNSYDGGSTAAAYGPTGPEAWLTSTSTNIFNLDVTVHPQFQSLVVAVSGVLNESLLTRYFNRLFKAYGKQDMPDTLITSTGVIQAMIEETGKSQISTSSYNLSNVSKQNFSRDGGPLRYQAGFDIVDPFFKWNGMKVGLLTSSFFPSGSDFSTSSYTGGRLWGLKLRDRNINRYIPPPLPGAKRGTAVGREVEFAYPMGGPMGIFKPLHDSNGQTTQWSEAPFNKWCEFAPKFMPGLKLTSLTEVL
jgi:hypothetical protein